jgi:oxygen-dependent protoporphyrinogen oxidase
LDVARLGHQYRVTTDSAATFSGDSVVLATPAFATARFVRSFDARVADACATVRYASAATVALAFPRSAVAHPLRGSGFVVPKVEGSGILAGTWLSSKWPHRAPEGYALMRAFLGGARDPDVMALSDGEMVDRALKALRPLLRITGAPLFTRVYRWDLANAQHEVGHLARVQAIERAVSAHPGLFVTGSGYRGVGIPDCIADGRATGRRVVEWMKNARVESRDVRAEI